MIFKVLGAGILGLGLALNIQYALNDYGLEEQSLCVAVLAQTNGTSGGGNTSGGDGTTGGGGNGYTRVTGACIYSGTAKANSSVKLGNNIVVQADKEGKWSYQSDKGEVRCVMDGKELCIPQNCLPLAGSNT